ncbi:MAG: hypothetical protein WCH34_10235 [Bacteroidota bacterium]
MKVHREAVVLPIHLLIADNVTYVSMSALIMHNYKDTPTMGNELTVKCFKSFSKDIKDGEHMAKQLETAFNMVKSTLKIKHKNQNDLRVLAHFKTMIELCKTMIMKKIESVLRSFNLFVFLGFVDDKVMEVVSMDCFHDKELEHAYIMGIRQTLSERNAILSFDQIIEELVPNQTLSASKINSSDFIKIPLWDFPPLIGLTYEQIKYTRENLQASFAQFKIELTELSDQIFNLSFNTENLPQIKQLCNEKIIPLISPVQQAIDESIYISRNKNQLPKKFNLRFCLGIASAETIINFYEKTEVLLPYVTSEIKDQTGKHIDLKSSHIFVYCEIEEMDELQQLIKSTVKIDMKVK